MNKQIRNIYCRLTLFKFYKLGIRTIFVIIFINILLFSCEKKINWSLQASEEQFLIVDGIITNEYKNQNINLSFSMPTLNSKPEFVSGAEVSVSDGSITRHFSEDTIAGNYISDDKFAAVINKTYTLNITYNKKTYFAEANMKPVSVSDPLPYIQVSDTNLYYIAAGIAEFNPDESAMYEVLLDWSNVPGYDSLPANQTSAHLFYYNLTTIDVNQIFSPKHEIVLFPHGSSITQRKYSLSLEHETFIRSLLSETRWNGGNFDVEEANVYTNLSEGALGFFGASSIITFSSTVQ